MFNKNTKQILENWKKPTWIMPVKQPKQKFTKKEKDDISRDHCLQDAKDAEYAEHEYYKK